MSSQTSRVKEGKVVGKGAEFSVKLGFQPKIVKLFNAAGLDSAKKNRCMPGKFAQKQSAAGASTFADNLVEIESDGFLIGSDADINASGEDIYYEAYSSNHE